MMYEIDDELAFLVDRLAPRRMPFENLSFQEGLRRVLYEYVPKPPTGDISKLASALVTARANLKKTPTPSAIDWATTVPDLKTFRHLTTWKAITDHLDIETGGDSARRKLSVWVRLNKPEWPQVPDID